MRALFKNLLFVNFEEITALQRGLMWRLKYRERHTCKVLFEDSTNKTTRIQFLVRRVCSCAELLKRKLCSSFFFPFNCVEKLPRLLCVCVRCLKCQNVVNQKLKLTERLTEQQTKYHRLIDIKICEVCPNCLKETR